MQSRPIRLVYDATNDVWIVPPPPQHPAKARPGRLDAFIDGVGTFLALMIISAVAYCFLAI